MLSTVGLFGQHNMMQKNWKVIETLVYEYSSESYFQDKSYTINTNMTRLRWFSKILAFLCLGWK